MANSRSRAAAQTPHASTTAARAGEEGSSGGSAERHRPARPDCRDPATAGDLALVLRFVCYRGVGGAVVRRARLQRARHRDEVA